MRTLVIAPGSVQRLVEVSDVAPAADDRAELNRILSDPEQRRQAEERLAAYARPAVELYAGTHHRLVVEATQAVWNVRGRETLDLAILSGSNGLLYADEMAFPWSVSLDQLDEGELAEWAHRLRISEQATSMVRDYDLAFYLLDGRYLAVLDLPLAVPDSMQQIVLTSGGSLPMVPAAPNIHTFVASGGVAARRWHVKADHVRAFLFWRLCNQVVSHGPVVLEWLHARPQDTEQLFYKRVRWRPQYPLWSNSSSP